MNLQGIKIAGTGSYTPEKILTNDDLSKIVDTNDEWILTRTGISERHIARDDEFTSDMAAAAAISALEAANTKPEELELIIVATLTPDKTFPNTASLVQKKINSPKAACFSIEAGCTGFVYALEIAAGMIGSGLYKNALIIGAEKLSSVVDWSDRTTCVLFGDGAGAAILKATAHEDNTYLGSDLGSNGEQHDILHIPAGGCAMPIDEENMNDGSRTLQMNGKEVFKHAINGMAASAKAALEKAKIGLEEIDWVVAHQANKRIISAVGQKLNIPEEKVYINVNRFGNTSAASVPLAFDEMIRKNMIKRGDKVLFVAFGGGLTWGASVIQY
jgi:3-oxoacyl-[acyl-carrier-protein] synthase III